MEAYEFYWRDIYGKDHLIGILPERRKDPKRISNKSIMNWGKKIVGNKPGPILKNLYFVQVKVGDFRKAKQTMQLVVRESSQGFDLEEVSSRKGTVKGLGLDGMRERTELSGGFFSIESSKGAGTAIGATWPLNS